MLEYSSIIILQIGSWSKQIWGRGVKEGKEAYIKQKQNVKSLSIKMFIQDMREHINFSFTLVWTNITPFYSEKDCSQSFLQSSPFHRQFSHLLNQRETEKLVCTQTLLSSLEMWMTLAQNPSLTKDRTEPCFLTSFVNSSL